VLWAGQVGQGRMIRGLLVQGGSELIGGWGSVTGSIVAGFDVRGMYLMMVMMTSIS